ncbi:hypothetical protein N658DRAFT_4802 [Parathielavia hyrcaniae]|uniref:Uncharacterized protein n=1 Tax=Parathielavia hyrcaniae TaxID=113614 RepID=A0AAN6Q9F6_9PEZI|nr:hypothetical protein N658DRAFT_4802 [Parathielavia hyrcaniae]
MTRGAVQFGRCRSILGHKTTCWATRCLPFQIRLKNVQRIQELGRTCRPHPLFKSFASRGHGPWKRCACQAAAYCGVPWPLTLMVRGIGHLSSWHPRQDAERCGMVGLAQQSVFLPNPLTSSESYRAVTAIVRDEGCPGTNRTTASPGVSGRWATAPADSKSHRRPTVPYHFPPHRRNGIQHGAGNTAAVDGLRRGQIPGRLIGRLLFYWSSGRFSPLQIIPCARSSWPNSFPVSPPPRRQGEVTKLTLHARLHRATTSTGPPPTLPFSPLPG